MRGDGWLRPGAAWGSGYGTFPSCLISRTTHKWKIGLACMCAANDQQHGTARAVCSLPEPEPTRSTEHRSEQVNSSLRGAKPSVIAQLHFVLPACWREFPSSCVCEHVTYMCVYPNLPPPPLSRPSQIRCDFCFVIVSDSGISFGPRGIFGEKFRR